MASRFRLVVDSVWQINLTHVLRPTMALIGAASPHLHLPLPLGLFVALCAVALAAYVAATNLVSWRRLNHVPGPPGAGWSKWWMLRNTLGGSMHVALERACNKYGPLVRIGPNDLVTDDPDVLRRMWAVRSPYKKGSFYDAVRFDPSRENIISMRNDSDHEKLRAKMASGYAGKENEGLEAAIDAQISEFIGLIERKYLSTDAEFRPIDLAMKAQYLTMDVITMLAFGRKFGYLAQDADVYDYIKITEENMPVMLVMSLFPALTKLLQSRLFRGLMPSERDPLGFGKFIGVAKQVVAERLVSPEPQRRDMLGSFLRHGLTREEAEGETLVQIIAGSDTTATAIRTTLLYLMGSPAAYAKLASEVRTAAAEGRISAPITDAQARQLPYLQAVIREGARVHPPVVGLMSTVVPKGGDVLCGFQVPEGTEVGSSAFAVQHSKDVYGADAALFRPERWIEAKGPKLKEMAATWDLIFKYGKWQCLGKTVALLELNKVFVELLRRFDLTLVDPTKPWKSHSAGIFIQSELWVKVTRVEESATRDTRV